VLYNQFIKPLLVKHASKLDPVFNSADNVITSQYVGYAAKLVERYGPDVANKAMAAVSRPRRAPAAGGLPQARGAPVSRPGGACRGAARRPLACLLLLWIVVGRRRQSMQRPATGGCENVTAELPRRRPRRRRLWRRPTTWPRA
jgi:hypothetical protein